ncbi:hypothetical protein C6A85_74560, partial [Mycobacterium sp. ITM-2017-0098]
MRVIAIMAAIILAATSCSGDVPVQDDVFSAATATIGESLPIAGWNMSVSNLRFDGDYVLVDVDAAPAQEGEPHAKPEDVRFGLYGALAHPLEANAVGGCDNVTSLG